MTTTLSRPAASAFTESAVKELAAQWYQLLDVHAPLVDVLPLLADAPEMVFPEVSFQTRAGFEGWYERVIRLFFDETHTLKVCDVVLGEDEARLKIVVEWQASVWHAPEPRSQRIHLDADQDWTVRASPRTGQPVITRYVVNSLRYHPGSATL